MPSDDAPTLGSTFTPWKRTLAANGGVTVGLGGVLLLFAGLWRAFEMAFLVSHPLEPAGALLLYVDYLTSGAFLGSSGFALAKRFTNGGDAVNYGIVVGMSGLLLLFASLGMAFEFMHTMWPSLGVVDVLLKYSELIAAGALIATLGFGLAPKLSDVRTETVHVVVGVALTIVAVTALAVGAYLFPIVFS